MSRLLFFISSLFSFDWDPVWDYGIDHKTSLRIKIKTNAMVHLASHQVKCNKLSKSISIAWFATNSKSNYFSHAWEEIKRDAMKVLNLSIFFVCKCILSGESSHSTPWNNLIRNDFIMLLALLFLLLVLLYEMNCCHKTMTHFEPSDDRNWNFDFLTFGQFVCVKCIICRNQLIIINLWSPYL